MWIDNLINDAEVHEKKADMKDFSDIKTGREIIEYIKDLDKRYFLWKNYVSSPNYTEPTKYFIFKDDYERFRVKDFGGVHPLPPVDMVDLGLGLGGVTYIGKNQTQINYNWNDFTREVTDVHEPLHDSNPNLSEKEVRDLVRIKMPHTKYH